LLNNPWKNKIKLREKAIFFDKANRDKNTKEEAK